MRGRPPSAVHSSEARKLRVGRTLLSVAFDPASDFALDFDFDLSRRDTHRHQHQRERAALQRALETGSSYAARDWDESCFAKADSP